MAVTPNSIISWQTPKLDLVLFSTANTSTGLTLLTAGANGSKIVGLYGLNSDTSDHLVRVDILRSGGSVAGGILTRLTAGAGFSTTIPPINLLSTALWPALPRDPDNNLFLFLQSTLDQLTCSFSTAAGAGTFCAVHAMRQDY